MNARPESFRSDDRIDSLRMPPQSNASEQAVLGGLMLSPESLWQIKDQLTESDFYRRDHRLIFRAITELAGKNKPFDVVTMGEWFEANALIDQVGGTGYLIDLASNTPSAANIRAYAEQVREKSVLRRLIEVGTEIVNDGFQPDGRAAGEVLAEAQQKMQGMVSNQPMRSQQAKVVLRKAFKALHEAYERGEHETGLLTGFADIDQATGGLQPEDFIILAARPGIGKTLLALNIAEHVAGVGKRVGVWSLEMSEQQLGMRMTSSLSRVPHDVLKRPWQLGDEHWPKLTDAVKNVAAFDMEILDAPDLTIDQLEGQAHQLHSRKPLDLIVVDYIGLMTPPKAERHELAMGEISRRIKKLAKRLRVPIIGVHQLNRSVESRAGREPGISDLRDTGRFEQDADMIWLMHRERYYDESAPDDCQLHIAKQRSGETRRLGLNSRLAVCRFENYEGSWVSYADRKKSKTSGSQNGFGDDDKPRSRTSQPRYGNGRGRDRAAGGDD
jgi:replicative DNA helicase